MAILAAAAAGVAAQQITPGQTLPLEHAVVGNTVRSSSEPAVTVRVPVSARYAGGSHIILYESSDCELHLFVEADAAKVVQRFYWIQFEHYLPTHPDLHHSYKFKSTATLGGETFDVRAQFGRTDDAAKRGSDLEQVQEILRRGGYTQPADMMNVRLVYLPDRQQRHELMMIYAENLKPTGYTTADLLPGGKAETLWPAITEQLVVRAKERIQVQMSTKP